MDNFFFVIPLNLRTRVKMKRAPAGLCLKPSLHSRRSSSRAGVGTACESENKHVDREQLAPYYSSTCYGS